MNLDNDKNSTHYERHMKIIKIHQKFENQLNQV